MPNEEHLGKLITRKIAFAVTLILGYGISITNPFVNPYLAIGISTLGGLLADRLVKHLFGLPPFGSRAQRALVGTIPAIATGITVSVVQHWNHDIKFFGGTSIWDWVVWSSGLAAVAASITALVPEKIWLRYWLTGGFDIILALGPPNDYLKKIASQLHDANPSVRSAAAKFFFWSARGGRPALLVLDDLVAALLHDTKINRDPKRSATDLQELYSMIDECGFSQMVSIAIAATIGAQILHIPWEETDLADFRQQCREILRQEEDEQVKADARLYLSRLFKETDVA